MSAEEIYQLRPSDKKLVDAAKLLVEKVLHNGIAGPAQIVSAAKLLHALNRLPRMTDEIEVHLSVSGPERIFGQIKTFHWWNVKLESGYLSLDCGGHFYQPGTGGDTFTTMTWAVSPGEFPDFSDYSAQHWIVPDLQTYEDISNIDFSTGGYSVQIIDPDNTLLDDTEDEELENEDFEDKDDEVFERVPFTITADGPFEAALAGHIDYDAVDAHEPDYSNAGGNCDSCQKALESLGLFVDGKIRGDIMWANLCARCFSARGEGIGWGRGQLYARQPSGGWRLVAGFQPAEE